MIRSKPSVTLLGVCALAFLAAIGSKLAFGAQLQLLPTTLNAKDRMVGSPGPWRPIPLLMTGVLLLAFAIFAILLLWGLPRGFEANAYHLPIAVRVLREGTLGLWDASYMHAYPANMSIWTGLLLHVFPENVTALANLPFIALAAFSLFALSRAAGADRAASLIIAVGLTSIPLFGFSALEVGPDIAGVAYIALAAFMIIVRPHGGRWWAALAGISAGVAFGFKSLHLIPLAILGLIILTEGLIGFAKERHAAARVSHLVPAATFGVSAFAMMSFWLVRNYVDLGNPLYPVHIAGFFDLLSWSAPPDIALIGRLETQYEWVRTATEWSVYPWIEWHNIDQNMKMSAGLGAFFAATGPVAWLTWAVFALVHIAKHKLTNCWTMQFRAQVILFLLSTGIMGVWWVLGDRQPRYFMAALLFVLPLAAWLVSNTKGRLRIAYEGLLSFSILVMLSVLGVSFVLKVGGTMVQDLSPPRYKLLEYPARIDELPENALVVNGEDRPLNYLLVGDNLRNRVMSTPEAKRKFTTVTGTWRFTEQAIRETGATHFYIHSSVRPKSDSCVEIKEVDRMDRNPFNGVPFAEPRILYALLVCQSPMTRSP